MHYEINVSLHGRHYFATHERSISCERKAIELYREFIDKFPITKGYRVSATKHQDLGEDVTLYFELQINSDESDN